MEGATIMGKSSKVATTPSPRNLRLSSMAMLTPRTDSMMRPAKVKIKVLGITVLKK